MQKCPRCQAKLRSANKDHFCPNHHGALLTLNDFQAETNRSFTKWFFASWLRFSNRRTISCPQCSTKMIQLNVEGKTKIELDCCPSCFSMWLDSGEEQLLQKLFQKHMETEKIRDLSSDQHQALANIIIEHDKKIQRYKYFERLGRLYSLKPGMNGIYGLRSSSLFLSMLFDEEKDKKN